MMNPLFKAFDAETMPMYDMAIIDGEGVEVKRYPFINNANNAHSVTKIFVATAIGTLCDKGALTLDTKITSLFDSSAFPEGMSPAWHEVTVRDALRHRTGIEDVPYGIDDDDSSVFIGNDFLKFIFSLEIKHTPGTYRRYSDAAYYLLGRVIHAVTGLTADEYMKQVIFDPLGFRQWAMAKCPQGHPICGGGFFARSDDLAKLAYTYACDGVYEGKRIISREWIEEAEENDYACSRFRDTDIFLKTGAMGQCVAYSRRRKCAAAWHGIAKDNGKRNDRLLSAFYDFMNEKYGEIQQEG